MAQTAKLLSLPSVIDGEVILVDNGSADGTWLAIQSLSQQNQNIVPVQVEQNIGYGFGILSGLAAARGDFVAWTHADGQMDFYDAATGFSMLALKENPGSFFVMGARKGRPLFDLLFTIGMGIFESLLFGQYVMDISAQPKVMTRSFVQSWKNPPKDFSLDLYAYLLAKKRSKKVLKFSVPVKERLHGTSSWNTGILSRLKLISRTIRYSLTLRKEWNSY